VRFRRPILQSGAFSLTESVKTTYKWDVDFFPAATSKSASEIARVNGPLTEDEKALNDPAINNQNSHSFTFEAIFLFFSAVTSGLLTIIRSLSTQI
jgi:hypothetical protein